MKLKCGEPCLLWHACNVGCGGVRCEGYVMGMIFDVGDVGVILPLCEMSMYCKNFKGCDGSYVKRG